LETLRLSRPAVFGYGDTLKAGSPEGQIEREIRLALRTAKVEAMIEKMTAINTPLN
jgi:hypothetical protein